MIVSKISVMNFSVGLVSTRSCSARLLCAISRAAKGLATVLTCGITPISVGRTPHVIATSLAIHSSAWSTICISFCGITLEPGGRTVTLKKLPRSPATAFRASWSSRIWFGVMLTSPGVM